MESANRRDLSVNRNWKSDTKMYGKYFEEITIFAKNFEKRMYSPRDVAYISIENVYFPKNRNGLTTKN